MSELALGVVVFTFLAVPASLLLLVLADVIRLEGEGRKRRWIRLCLWALAIPAAVPVGLAAWGAAGAAHLEPLCQAYATPEFRGTRAIDDAVLLLDLQPRAATPAWAAPLATTFGDRLIVDAADPAAARATHVLEVRSVTHHRNLWFDVRMARFRLLERQWGTVLAEGDELWVDAGRQRHHCGIVSGSTPVQRESSPWPAGQGAADFVARGLRPAPFKP